MEILVRVIDKDQPDPILAPLASKRGDVIAICPDGWPWSPAERTEDFWRIISCDILQTTAGALLSKNESPLAPKRRRDWTIDFSRLPDPALFNGARTAEVIMVTRGQLASAIDRKP